MLDEPHKLNQNGCAILRRNAGRPRFAAERPHCVVNALRELVSSARVATTTPTVDGSSAMALPA